MLEEWTQWKPIKHLVSKYYIDSVVDTIKGFKIELSQYDSPKNKICVLFQNSVYSYRSVDESFISNILGELSKKYGKSFFHSWTFFKVTNSSYLQWLSQQSEGISDYRLLIHFSFISFDSILDVICDYEPIIECFEEK